MFEIRIEATSRAAGRSIRDLGLPTDVLISSIVRRARIVPPKGSTVIATDDLLFVLAPKSEIEEVSRVLNEPERKLSAEESLEMEIESRR
jgi:Trk K+ transport system NAD-binding subunit